MPVLNPKRILTRDGREAFILQLNGEDIDGPFFGAKLIAVTAVEFDTFNEQIVSATPAPNGVGTAQPITSWAAPQKSSSGKIYSASDLVNFVAGGSPTPHTVVGVVLTKTSLAADVLGYMEFDEPIEMDDTGEIIQMAMEVGFDGQEFYIAPRVLPLGV